MIFLFGGRGTENIERRRKKTGRRKTLKRKRKKNKVYNRVTTGVGAVEKLENKYTFWCGRLEKLEFLKCLIKILILFFRVSSLSSFHYT